MRQQVPKWYEEKRIPYRQLIIFDYLLFFSKINNNYIGQCFKDQARQYVNLHPFNAATN